ncbi:Oidioi.mRNA.OKI2018_I69.chr1.g2981.t1.cds [Oikopleura dioica]|uniref:Oidioi.mRNA.OKI2018_I69.chr1.g2981.t1.cds n=1 Tax=Oikopleura dioica TaxID=34765 RepID=A0ABN7SWZ5_OIKDI|nr:Oidioi.mRNA.OKI2018_I69.chr1.g2981.t1.cds [Oikopleura dioica]
MMGRRPPTTMSPKPTMPTGLETTTSPQGNDGDRDMIFCVSYSDCLIKFFSKEVAIIVIILIWLYFVFRLIIQAIVVVKTSTRPATHQPEAQHSSATQQEAHRQEALRPSSQQTISQQPQAQTQTGVPELEWDNSFDLPIDLSTTGPRANASAASSTGTTSQTSAACNSTPISLAGTSSTSRNMTTPRIQTTARALPSASAQKKSSARLSQPKASQIACRPPWNASVRTSTPASTNTRAQPSVEQQARAVRQRKQPTTLSINHSLKKY